MGEDPELRKELKPGDRVRFVRSPTTEGYMQPETLAVYDRLAKSGQTLEIDFLEFHDGQSYPWTKSFEVEGIEGTHILMLNDDGLERVY